MVGFMALAATNLLSASAHTGSAVSLGTNPVTSGFISIGPGTDATLVEVPSGQEFIVTNYKITYSGPSGVVHCKSSKCDLKVGGKDLGAYIGNSAIGQGLTVVVGSEGTLVADNNNGSSSSCGGTANCLYYFDGYFVQE